MGMFTGRQLRNRYREFRREWKDAALAGSCDAEGGAEWARVSREYVAAGCPADIRAFILTRANISSDEAGPNFEMLFQLAMGAGVMVFDDQDLDDEDLDDENLDDTP